MNIYHFNKYDYYSYGGTETLCGNKGRYYWDWTPPAKKIRIEQFKTNPLACEVCLLLLFSEGY